MNDIIKYAVDGPAMWDHVVEQYQCPITGDVVSIIERTFGVDVTVCRAGMRGTQNTTFNHRDMATARRRMPNVTGWNRIR